LNAGFRTKLAVWADVSWGHRGFAAARSNPFQHPNPTESLMRKTFVAPKLVAEMSLAKLTLAVCTLSHPCA
jgi:hypothetical protein